MVSTSPINFTSLPRQEGNNLADPPGAQAPLASAINANIAAINSHLVSSWQPQFQVVRVKPVISFTTNVKWNVTNNYVDGLIIGELRMLMIAVNWNTTTLIGDSYGGIADKQIATLTDPRFLPGGGRNLWFTGDFAKGMCTFYLTPTGGIWIAGLGGKYATLVTNDYLAFNYSYLVYGS